MHFPKTSHFPITLSVNYQMKYQKTTVERKSGILDLPDDLLAIIARRTDDAGRRALPLVCQSFGKQLCVFKINLYIDNLKLQ